MFLLVKFLKFTIYKLPRRENIIDNSLAKVTKELIYLTKILIFIEGHKQHVLTSIST